MKTTVRATEHAVIRAASATNRVAHLAARKAHLPKACFLGVTAIGSLLFAVLASLSQS
jgi:hypothetical protein